MANDQTKVKAIAANLEALRTVLSDASKRADEALAAILDNEVNAAMGAVDGMGHLLDEASALYGAARALHCGKGRRS